MNNVEKNKKCCGCGQCADICPKKCITMKLNKNGFIRPIIDNKKCILCNKCVKSCPTINIIESSNTIHDIKSYAVWMNSEDILQSSSGGVFYALARNFIIEKRGSVIGCTLMPNNKAIHICINTIKDLTRLQGSKYIQSNLTGMFALVKKKINQNEYILFSGLPCQIAALYKYLGTLSNSSYLYTIELICHGVPSFYAVKGALKTLKVKQIYSFRTKFIDASQKNCFHISVKGKPQIPKDAYIYDKETDKSIILNRKYDLFYKFFFSDLALNDICYKCKYSKIPRISDVSLADLWGNKHPFQSNYDKGISLVLCNNERGNNLIKNNKDLFYHSIQWEQFLFGNPNIITNRDFLYKYRISNLLHILKFIPPTFWDLLLKYNPKKYLSWKKYKRMNPSKILRDRVQKFIKENKNYQWKQ